MTSPTEKAHALTTWADALACPVCRGNLREDSGRVTCLDCGNMYPIEDGIPVLIAERNLNAPSR